MRAGDDSEFVLLPAKPWLHAMRNPGLRETLARRMREPHDAMQTTLDPLLERIGRRDTVSPEVVVTPVLALFQGLVPGNLFGLFGQGLRWLFAGIAAAPGDPKG